ncbi:MAG: hypothetical protein HZC43_08650 [Nitrosomonadales bacterium]|nr:hypothetical protein [Nitrosomonadales bacterium]
MAKIPSIEIDVTGNKPFASNVRGIYAILPQPPQLFAASKNFPQAARLKMQIEFRAMLDKLDDVDIAACGVTHHPLNLQR